MVEKYARRGAAFRDGKESVIDIKFGKIKIDLNFGP